MYKSSKYVKFGQCLYLGDPFCTCAELSVDECKLAFVLPSLSWIFLTNSHQYLNLFKVGKSEWKPIKKKASWQLPSSCSLIVFHSCLIARFAP